jgi:quinol monooxygenase YgiN
MPGRAGPVRSRPARARIEYQPLIDAACFGGFQAPVGADGFVVIEKWRDAAALEAHAGVAHMAAYAARTTPLVAQRRIHVMVSPA